MVLPTQKTRSAVASVEELRNRLPVHLYTYLLHQAATTGYMPTLNEYGRPIPADTIPVKMRPSVFLETKERVKILTYLIDKRLPTMRPIELLSKSGAEALSKAPSQARHLSAVALAAAAAGGDDEDQPMEAVHDPSPESLFGVPDPEE